jgi:hypothetical protein
LNRIALVRPYLIALLAVACLAAACTSSGDSDDVIDSTTSNPAGAAVPSTSVSVPVAVATSAPADSVTRVAPLTGREADMEPARPALVVKIDNHDRARPQFGINQADIVFEEIVEGGITRLAAVFHSQQADPVGPIRSARTSDFELLSNLNRPLFANSGGNEIVLALLREIEMIDVSANAAVDAYYRLDERRAPHNLLTDTDTLWAAGARRGGEPTSLLSYREDTDPPLESARRSAGVRIDFGTNEVEFKWDPTRAGWLRRQNGTPHIDADGLLVAPANVIVQFVSYGRSVANSASPEAQLIGDGAVWVFTNGQLVEGPWSRPTSSDVTSLMDFAGEPITLTPGRTWVELPRIGQVTRLEDVESLSGGGASDPDAQNEDGDVGP